MTTDNLLSVSNLNVYYGESHILRNVDLSIPKGQMVCLIGRNGVGKTTFLKTIIGLLKQRSGSMQYDDQALSDQPPTNAPVPASAMCPRGVTSFHR